MTVPPHRRGRLGRLASSFATTVLCCLMAAGAAADGPGDELNRLLADGDLEGARAVLSAWAEHDDDPRLCYNLACLECMLGEHDAAAAQLERAVALGFDDLRRLTTDPDLADLRDRDDVRVLTAGLEAGLARAAERLGAVLAPGDVRTYRLRDAEGRERSDTKFEVGAGTRGLEIRLRLPAGFYRQNDAPWSFGGGVELTVVVPDSQDVFDTPRAWRFGYGLREGLPVGVMLSTPERRVLQPVLELAPELEWDPATASRTLAAVVPWTVFTPFLPPTDLRFGLNVRAVAGGGDRRRDLSLVVDPAAGLPPGIRLRFAPLEMPPSPDGSLSFGGRVGRTVIGLAPLDFELVVWSPTAGEAVLSAEIRDPDGNSVVSSGGGDVTVALAPGFNRRPRRADLSQLPAGSYRLVASITLPEGERLEWSQRLFRFDPAWLHRTEDRLKTLTEAERPSLDWRLDLIADALATHDPRTSPAALMTTVAETEKLLDRRDAEGTLLGAGGTTVLAFADDAGRRRSVVVHAGPGYRSGEPVSAALLVAGPEAAGAVLEAWPGPGTDETPWVIAVIDGVDAAAVAGIRAWLGEILNGREPIVATVYPEIYSAVPASILLDTDDPAAAAATVRDTAPEVR